MVGLVIIKANGNPVWRIPLSEFVSLEKLRNIKALVSDVDGVMTDGTIVVSEGGETKHFSVRDGLGIKLMQKAGLQFALLSGRHSAPLEERARELTITAVKIGRIDKQAALMELVAETGVPVEEMAYIGDDLPDLAPLQMVAAPFCPANAVEEVQAIAETVPLDGGRGVVRYVIERILKAQGRWDELVRYFEVKP